MHRNYNTGLSFGPNDFDDRVIEGDIFENCTFNRTRLSNIRFDDCIFDDCTFTGCDMSMIGVKLSTFRNVAFEDCKMLGIAWDDAAKPLKVSFKNCVLNYCSFYGVDLRKQLFDHCTLHEANFTEANLESATFSHCDLKGAYFFQTNLFFTDFATATNYQLHLGQNKVKRTVFTLPEAVALLNAFDVVVK